MCKFHPGSRFFSRCAREIQEKARKAKEKLISREFPGNLLENYRKFPGNFPEKSRKFPGQIPEISREFPGNFPENYRKFPGNFLEISRNFPGIFPEISRKFPGNFPEIFRKFPGTSKKSRDRHREKLRKSKEKQVFIVFFLVFLFFSLAFHWNFTREGFSQIPSKYPFTPLKSFPCQFSLCRPPKSGSKLIILCSLNLFSLDCGAALGRNVLLTEITFTLT